MTVRRRKLAGLAFAALLALGRGPIVPSAAAESPLDEDLKRVTFDQRLGRQVTLDLVFRDESGRPISLRECFQGKPVILVPGYYRCPMLCGAVANGLVQSLRELPLSAGRDFTVVHFSVDPSETPELAARKQHGYLQAYHREGAQAGWRFLTGEEASDRQLADEIGFHYLYETASKQYAHPSGIVVLTPEGKISQYAFGVSYPSAALHRSLEAAAGSRIASPIRRLILLCFRYQPFTGKYAPAALGTLRVAALALLAALGGWIVMALRSEKRNEPNPPG